MPPCSCAAIDEKLKVHTDFVFFFFSFANKRYCMEVTDSSDKAWQAGTCVRWSGVKEAFNCHWVQHIKSELLYILLCELWSPVFTLGLCEAPNCTFHFSLKSSTLCLCSNVYAGMKINFFLKKNKRQEGYESQSLATVWPRITTARHSREQSNVDRKRKANGLPGQPSDLSGPGWVQHVLHGEHQTQPHLP